MEQGRILERLKDQRRILDTAIKSLEEAVASNKANVKEVKTQPIKKVEAPLVKKAPLKKEIK